MSDVVLEEVKRIIRESEIIKCVDRLLTSLEKMTKTGQHLIVWVDKSWRSS